MILNLTQHSASAEQRAAGVCDTAHPQEVSALLTFDALPSAADIEARAQALARVAARYLSGQLDNPTGEGQAEVMIGGAPYLMAPLERALMARGIAPIYAFSVRASTETTLPDGSVRKTAVFRHGGFIDAVRS